MLARCFSPIARRAPASFRCRMPISSPVGAQARRPPGIGALLVKDLATLAAGGGQEKGYRRGTQNLPGAAGIGRRA